MRKRINAFTTSEEQQEAISQWRERAKASDGRVLQLRKTIQCRKRDNEINNKTRTWLEDMETLDKEQEVVEKQLDMFSCSSKSSREANSLFLRGVVRQKLQSLQLGSVRGSKGDQGILKEHLNDLKGFILEEQHKIKNEEENASHFADDTNAMEFFQRALEEIDIIFLNAENALEPSDGGKEIFVNALHLEKEEALHQIDQIGDVRVTSDSKVLWNANEIIKIDLKAKQKTVKIVDTELLCDRLHGIFPSLTRKELKTAIEEANQLRAKSTAVHNVILHVKHVVDDIVAAHKHIVSAASASRKFKTIVEADEALINNKKEYLHSKLDHQRTIFNEKMSIKQKELQKQALEEEKAEMMRKQQLLEEFKKRLKLLEEYEERKKELKKREDELIQLKQQEEEADKRERMVTNAERVLFRQNVLAERQLEHQRRERELESIRKQKEAAIQRFFDSVEERIGVQADFARLLQATKSSEQSTAYVSFAEMSNGKGMHGYTDEKIMKDPRVRLYHALLAAGLHTSVYGRQKITEGYRVPPALQVSEGNPFGL